MKYISASYTSTVVISTLKRVLHPNKPCTCARLYCRRVHPPPEESPATILDECVACERRQHMEDFPKRHLGGNCEHSDDTCRSCWVAWLSAQIESVPPDQISCAQCTNILTEADIGAHASSEAYLRYYLLGINDNQLELTRTQLPCRFPHRNPFCRRRLPLVHLRGL
jgi:hypothetical protein